MKILHTSIAVKDMDESIRFYRDVLGLKFLRRMKRGKSKMEKRPENNREIAFLENEDGTQIELTFWSENEKWTSGDELDHIALSVPDMDKAIEIFKRKKVDIVKEPFYREGATNRIVFIKDPNGVWLEIIERK